MTDSTKPSDATSFKETAFGIIPRDKLVLKEAEGIAKGLTYILELPKDAALTPDLLLEIHRICFGWIFPDWAGKFRDIEVQTSTHTFPPFTKVPALVKDFFDDISEWLQHEFDPIEIIAWAQYCLTWIHPFQDYNGRTARLFSNYLMIRFDLPLVEIKVESEEERKDYIKALKLGDEGNLKSLEKMIRSAIQNI